MKRIIIIVSVLFPMLLNAGVIVKKSGEKIEHVTIKSVTDTEILYKTSKGGNASISKSEASAILYDDGRYEEIQTQKAAVIEDDEPQKSSSAMETSRNDEPKEKGEKRMIPQLCYKEASKVYKAVYKEHYDNALQQGFSKSQAYKIASEEAYEAKQKALDECYTQIVVEGKEYVPSITVKEEGTKAQKQPTSKPAKKIIPQACYAEGNKVYKETFKAAQEKALHQGYSKTQAYMVASDAAQEAKQQAIDECYNNTVGE